MDGIILCMDVYDVNLIGFDVMGVVPARSSIIFHFVLLLLLLYIHIYYCAKYFRVTSIVLKRTITKQKRDKFNSKVHVCASN